MLVDLQMRPVNPTHLAYAMNVLDWPAGDVDGQIQHKADTTFADSNNPDIENPDDDAGSHGDMRLVPLLEIVMTGAQIPLKLTEPAADGHRGQRHRAVEHGDSEARRRQPANTQFHLHPASGRQPGGLCGHVRGPGRTAGHLHRDDRYDHRQTGGASSPTAITRWSSRPAASRSAPTSRTS